MPWVAPTVVTLEWPCLSLCQEQGVGVTGIVWNHLDAQVDADCDRTPNHIENGLVTPLCVESMAVADTDSYSLASQKM